MIERAVVATGLTAVLVGLYALISRLSSGSIGWGDVLLVAPVSLAVAYVDSELLATWQLLATSSAAVHATLQTIRRGLSSIPFGPHLLLWALVVLIASL